MALRKAIAVDSPVFSRNVVHSRTLSNWRNDVSAEALESKLRDMVGAFLSSGHRFTFKLPTGKLAGSMLDQMHSLSPGFGFRNVDIEVAGGLWLGGSHEGELTKLTLIDLQEAKASQETLLYMMLATHRALIQEQMGPLPGSPLNLTIAGAMGVCYALGFKVNIEG